MKINSIILIFIGIGFIVGCEPKYPASPSFSDKQTTNVLFINALPDDSLVTFKIDNSEVASKISTGNSSGYISMYTGPRVIAAVNPTDGLSISTTTNVFPWQTASSSNTVSLSSTTASSDLLAINNPTLFPNQHFTIVAEGSVLKKRDRILLVDNLTSPASGKTNIRLVNAIPSGVSASLSYTSTGTSSLIISNRSYVATGGTVSAVQSFTAIDPAKKLYLLNTATTLSNFVVMDSIEAGTLSLGSNFTLLAMKKSGKNRLVSIVH